MGTLNKFAGKIKSLFQRPWKTNKNTDKSFERAMETAQAEAIETRADKKESIGTKQPVLKRGNRNRYQSKPPWWVKFYGKKTRAEIGLLNKHMVQCFGTFSPVKRFQ